MTRVIAVLDLEPQIPTRRTRLPAAAHRRRPHGDHPSGRTLARSAAPYPGICSWLRARAGTRNRGVLLQL